MDFVVSKVVMSICALMVVSILGGMFGTDALLDHGNELESIASEFCSIADSTAISSSEVCLSWTVPFTSSGGVVRFSLNNSVVRVESEGGSAVDQPVCAVHTWSPLRGPLNSSELASLDKSSPRVESHSGDGLLLVSRLTLVDESWEMLVFARLSN